MPTVQIGEDQVAIQEFSAAKAFTAMAIVKSTLQAYPQLLGELHAFIRNYEADNQTEMDRSTALFIHGPERLAHLTDADWEASGNRLLLPRSPSLEEQIASLFPAAFDMARGQVLKLCALAVITNRELEDADAEGGDPAIDALIDGRARRLVHEAKIDQLLELLVVAAEITKDQVGTKLDGLKERLGNALRLFGWRLPWSQPDEEAGAQQEATPSTDPPTAPEDSPTRPPSSTSSPAPTDGTEPRSSTEPAGASLSSSAPA